MNQDSVDRDGPIGLTATMPRRPNPDKDNMVNVGLKVPPPYKDYLQTICETEDEQFEGTVARKIFLKGFALYLKEKTLKLTPKERETLSKFLEEHPGKAREVDVERKSEENTSSRRGLG